MSDKAKGATFSVYVDNVPPELADEFQLVMELMCDLWTKDHPPEQQATPLGYVWDDEGDGTPETG